jgi:predicted permease
MSQYRIFIAAFMISIIAMVVFFATYFNGLMNVMRVAVHNEGVPVDPFYFFRMIFSPLMITSLAILIISGLLYKVLGIIFVARNSKLPGGEQAIWIIGFVLFGFITAIVFMAIGKSRGLVSASEKEVYRQDNL